MASFNLKYDVEGYTYLGKFESGDTVKNTYTETVTVDLLDASTLEPSGNPIEIKAGETATLSDAGNYVITKPLANRGSTPQPTIIAD